MAKSELGFHNFGADKTTIDNFADLPNIKTKEKLVLYCNFIKIVLLIKKIYLEMGSARTNGQRHENRCEKSSSQLQGVF